VILHKHSQKQKKHFEKQKTSPFPTIENLPKKKEGKFSSMRMLMSNNGGVDVRISMKIITNVNII
jgi:hypothetical protein